VISGLGSEGNVQDGPEVQYVELCGGISVALEEKLIMLEDTNAQVMIESGLEASGGEGANGDEGVRGGVYYGKGANDRAEVSEMGAQEGGIVAESYGDGVGPRGSLKAELGDGGRVGDRYVSTAVGNAVSAVSVQGGLEACKVMGWWWGCGEADTFGDLRGESGRLNLWPRRRGCLRHGRRIGSMGLEGGLYSWRDVQRGGVGLDVAGGVGGIGGERRVL
jgi:hypothetical protein